MDMGKKPLGSETRVPKTDEKVTAANEAPVQPMAVKEKKHYQSKRFVLWRTVVILLLIAATALVVAGWFYTQDLYSQLNKKEAEIAELQSVDKTDAKLDEATQLSELDMSEKAQESRVLQAASAYYCNIVDFGCDKVLSNVTRLDEYTLDGADSSDGFAIVAAQGANGSTTKLYLKSVDGLTWVVVYDGQNTPPKETADKFDIPE